MNKHLCDHMICAACAYLNSMGFTAIISRKPPNVLEFWRLIILRVSWRFTSPPYGYFQKYQQLSMSGFPQHAHTENHLGLKETAQVSLEELGRTLLHLSEWAKHWQAQMQWETSWCKNLEEHQVHQWFPLWSSNFSYPPWVNPSYSTPMVLVVTWLW